MDLYRHYDAAGKLLYVGISFSAFTRSKTHLRASKWAHEIARIEIEKHPTRDAALKAESFAIWAESPKYNIKQTPAAKGGRKSGPRISGEDASNLIRIAGGDAAFARMLGISSKQGFPQRVNNWKRRGIPPAMELEHYETIRDLKIQIASSRPSSASP